MGLSDEQYRKVMRKGWNLTIDEYDRSWVAVLRQYAAGCVERAQLGAGDRVLDVATGPGTAAFLAAERVGTSGRVVGTDISDNFVAAAAATAHARGLPQVTFERHAMEQLALPDASFDAALCVLGLMYAAPYLSSLAEIQRVLKPGGRFAACVWGQRAKCGFRDVFSVLGGPLQMDVCPLFFALGNPGAFVAALSASGFADAREERVELTLRWDGERDACAAMFEGGPAAHPWSLFPPEIKEQVAAAYVASLAPYRVGAGFEVPAEFVYATARKP